MKYVGESGLSKLLTLIKTKIESLTASDVGAIPITFGAVETNNIADSAVTSAKIASTSVNTSKLVNGSVTESKIGDNAITSAKLADGAITNSKLGSASVGASNLIDSSVITSKVAASAVTTEKVAASAITRAKLANDALYSPLVQKSSSYTLTANDIGKTIFSDSSSPSDVRVITLDATNNDALPIGAEFAVMAGNTGTTKLTVEAGVGVRGNKDGDVLSSDGITVTIPRYCMIALKKLYAKHWLITGVFEVET